MNDDHSRARGASVSRLVFFGFLAIAAYFLITEHRAHIVPWLPFLLLAACPLLHFFHHRNHGNGADADRPGSSEPRVGASGGHRH